MKTEALVEDLLSWVARKRREIDDANVEITPDTDLLETGVLDSLGLVDLVTYIEERTGRTVDLLEIDPKDFTTVRGLSRAVGGGS